MAPYSTRTLLPSTWGTGTVVREKERVYQNYPYEYARTYVRYGP